MEIELVADGDPAARAAVLAALAAAGDGLAAVRDPYASAWRAAGLAEGVDRAAADGTDGGVAYALSPRRTRGATRA